MLGHASDHQLACALVRQCDSNAVHGHGSAVVRLRYTCLTVMLPDKNTCRQQITAVCHHLTGGVAAQAAQLQRCQPDTMCRLLGMRFTDKLNFV